MEKQKNKIISVNQFKQEIKRIYHSSSDIIKKLFCYFDYNSAINIFTLDYFDEIKNSEYPFLLDVIMIYCDGFEERLLAIGYDYVQKEDIILVRLLSTSFHDDDLVEGVLLSTQYQKEKGLIIQDVIKEG